MVELPSKLKDLPAKYSHLCLRIKNFVSKELNLDLKGKKLLLAVSGGVDSLAMLCILNVLKSSMGFSISVCHLNHGLRPEANTEYDFVQSICKKNNILFFGGRSKVRVYSRACKIGIEEAARNIRYKFLQGIRLKTCSDFIVTAHHLNDLAEDILMRLIRGVGWPSLGGMKAIDDTGKILRPLLLISKIELQDFLQDIDISWHEDMSNYDLKYKRNRMRHKLLPLILEENPNFLKTVANLWLLSRIDERYFSSILAGLYTTTKRHENFIVVPRAKVTSWEQSIRLRFYKSIISDYGKTQTLFSNLINLDRCIIHYSGPKTIQFPGNKIVEVTKGEIKFIL